jgi:hypothetical protein
MSDNNLIVNIENLKGVKILNTENLKNKSNNILKILGIKEPTDKQKYDLMTYLHEIS